VSTPTLTPQERGRLAHRVLRLRESGLQNEDQLRSLAFSSPPPKALDEGENIEIQFNTSTHPLAPTARSVVNHQDENAEGPTDAKLTKKLLELPSLTDIYKMWDEATQEAQEATLSDKDLKALRASQEKDRAEAEEGWAKMQETGDFPVHDGFGHNRHLDGAANALYDFGRQGFLDATIDWDTAVIKMVLVDSGTYTVNLSTHQFMSSVTGIVGTAVTLGSKTVTAGVADAADATFTAVSGASVEALLIYQASAVTGGADVASSAQRTIAYIDTATGLPVTPNGGDISVTFDSGTNRIFKL
jgi:hypothetical protein